MPVIGPGFETGGVAPAPGSAEPVRAASTPARRTPAETQFISVFGDVQRSGVWTLGENVTAVTTFGDVFLDLREADLPPESTISGYGCFGDLKIVVPPDVEVQLRGVSIFGDRKVDDTRRTPAPPHRLLVDGFNLFGDVKVLTLEPGEKVKKRWKWF